MLKDNVDKDRCIRFYRWAAVEAEREVRQGYPLLRQVPTVGAHTHLHLVAGMGLEEQLQLSEALVNWAHQVARSLLGEKFSDADNFLREQYLAKARRQWSSIEHALYSPFPEDTPYQKKRFAALLRSKLLPILGKPLKKGPPYVGSDLVYVTPIHGWFIGTRFQFLQGRNGVRYWQNVMAELDEYPGSLGNPAQNSTNISNWLGIGRNEIEIPFERNEEATVEVLTLVCSYLLEAMPAILDGLTAEVMEYGEWDGIFWYQKLWTAARSSVT